jgi:hypothetical protein
MKKSLLIILAVAAAVVLVLAGLGIGYALFTRSVPSTCELVTPDSIAIYSDAAGTLPLEAIDWGKLDGDTFLQRVVYLKNTSASAVTVSSAGINWVPGEQSGVVCNSPATAVPADGSLVPTTITLDARGATYVGALSWDQQFTANGS